MTDEKPDKHQSYVAVNFDSPMSVLHEIRYQGVAPMQIALAGLMLTRAGEKMMRQMEDQVEARAAATALVVPGGGRIG